MKIGRYLLAMLALCVTGVAPAHATEQVTICLTDALGTPVVEMNGQGEVINRSQYRPYGKQTQGSGEAGPGFTGHVSDPDTGLVYMQQRYYDPDGRFISPDPITPTPGDIYNFNRYAYAGNNPIMHVDPDGRTFGIDDTAGFLIGGTIGVGVEVIKSELAGEPVTWVVQPAHLFLAA